MSVTSWLESIAPRSRLDARWVSLVGLLAVVCIGLGVAATIGPSTVPRSLLIASLGALAFVVVAVFVRDLSGPLLVSVGVLITLQNVPIAFTAAEARAGGAPRRATALAS